MSFDLSSFFTGFCTVAIAFLVFLAGYLVGLIDGTGK